MWFVRVPNQTLKYNLATGWVQISLAPLPHGNPAQKSNLVYLPGGSRCSGSALIMYSLHGDWFTETARLHLGNGSQLDDRHYIFTEAQIFIE